MNYSLISDTLDFDLVEWDLISHSLWSGRERNVLLMWVFFFNCRTPSTHEMYRREISCTCMLCFCILLCALCLQECQGQAYHFSRGWFPGRKRSSPPLPPSFAASSSEESLEDLEREVVSRFQPLRSQKSSEVLNYFHTLAPANYARMLRDQQMDTCQVKPQVQQLIDRLIQVRDFNVRFWLVWALCISEHIWDRLPAGRIIRYGNTTGVSRGMPQVG